MSDILTITICNSVVLAGVGFLTKSIISHQLDKDTARFTAELTASTEKELASFRSGLEADRMRLQISYGGIFEKQANAMLELFQLATEFRRLAVNTLDVEEEDREARNKFREAWAQLNDSYQKNRVLLPAELDKRLHVFIDDFFLKVLHHQRLQKQYKSVRSDAQFDRIWERQEEARGIIEKVMPVLLEEMVEMMRGLLGTSAASSMGGRG